MTAQPNADIAALRTLLDEAQSRNPGLLLADHAPALQALLTELEARRAAPRAPVSREADGTVVLRRMRDPADEGPITGASIAQRMMTICGCQGRYDCDCVSVKNQARIDLWTEYNTTGPGAAR